MTGATTSFEHATVVGAGTFGTAIAIVLARAGVQTQLMTRLPKKADELIAMRENVEHLPGHPLPPELEISEYRPADISTELLLLGMPSYHLDSALEDLGQVNVPAGAVIVSMAKGLMHPDGASPVERLGDQFGRQRIAFLGGPSHASEMVASGARLVAAANSKALAGRIAEVFDGGGVACDAASDPLGAELAGTAKNVATLGAAAALVHGLNAAGAVAGAIFAEVWRYARAAGVGAESMIGVLGTGDLVATVLAPRSRNRQAGELLAQGMPASEITPRLGQAVEALETTPLLAARMEATGTDAPTIATLARLIEGHGHLGDVLAAARFPTGGPREVV
jgi:glycerol-3-phosphate dehydrogenase (NAD(P)+)